MFRPKIKDWNQMTFIDGSVIKHKNDSPPLAGSGAYKPGKDTAPPSQHLQLHIKPNGCGLTNNINRADLQASLWHYNKGKQGVTMGYKRKRPQSRRLTASLFKNTHEIMKEKGKDAVIL
eukprot:163131-Pelagomonas_calceolata.AAC.1